MREKGNGGRKRETSTRDTAETVAKLGLFGEITLDQPERRGASRDHDGSDSLERGYIERLRNVRQGLIKESQAAKEEAAQIGGPIQNDEPTANGIPPPAKSDRPSKDKPTEPEKTEPVVLTKNLA